MAGFVSFFFFSSRRRHTRCALVTGVQTCALPIYAELMANAKTLAADSGLPPELAKIWDRVISFLEGTGGGGPAIPTGPGAPVIQQFLYPTLGNGCLPGGNSVGPPLPPAGPQPAARKSGA